RLTVIAGTVTGSPALTAAWRAGFILLPACTTLPITTVPISAGLRPARATAAAIAAAPSSAAVVSLRVPPNVPIAVRTGAARTIERAIGISCAMSVYTLRLYGRGRRRRQGAPGAAPSPRGRIRDRSGSG